MTKEEATTVLMEERLYEIEHAGDSPKGEALKMAISALRIQQKQEGECAKCSGIVYRQTDSGKVIPVDQRCGAKIMPPCYVPDSDGCAYQTYGDNDDEPIDRCKSCPLCQSDKTRHKQDSAHNDPLTLDELRQMDGEPVWIVCDEAAVETTPGFEPLAFWALVEVCEESIFLTNNLGGRTEYATDVEFEDDGVIVYRHKPEEGA